LSYSAARDEARAFFLTTPESRDPRYAAYYQRDVPEFFELFGARIVYPLISAFLFPLRGYSALATTSFLAYVGAVLALYWLLLAITRPLVAAIVCVGFAISSGILAAAASALSDMTALAFWITALGALARIHTRARWTLIVFVAAATLLTLTRPLPYLPFGAAAGLALAFWLRGDRADALRAAFCAALCVLDAALVMVLATLFHAPGTAELMRYAQHRVNELTGRPDRPFWQWYRFTIVDIFKDEIKRAVLNVLPLVAIFGALRGRADPRAAMLAGAALFDLVGIFFNPIPFDMARVFELPLYPIIAAGITFAARIPARAS